MVRITTIVAAISGKDVYFVFREMPLLAVFLYEHQYYNQQGIEVRPAKWKNTLDELVRGL